MNNKKKSRITAPAHPPQRPQLSASPRELDPRMAAAIARGEIAKKKMAAAEGGAISGAEAGRLLGITQAAVIRRWQRHRLVGWPEGNAVLFPVWQFQDGQMLEGIEEVLQILRSHDHWRVMLYFLAHRRSLNRQRPLDLLRRGETVVVITHATNHMLENEW